VKEIILEPDVPFLPIRLFSAGDISCYYEAGNLRYIKCGDTELVRMIYSAVRDENWDTLPMTISDEKVESTTDSFAISYKANYRSGAINYMASMLIEGYDNMIRFTMNGEALSSFKKNRIGLCVHHPLSCIGLPVRIIRPDGDVVESSFPERVSPHQPFTYIRSMEWIATSGVQATLKFEGEIFETEDQRNWTDASFKTYSTPLIIPFPATLQTGDKMEHTITLTAVLSDPRSRADESVEREEKICFPEIGYCQTERGERLSESQVKRLTMIPLNHIRVTIRLYQDNWRDELAKAAAASEMTTATLQLVVYVDDRYEEISSALIEALRRFERLVASLLFLKKDEDVTPADVLQYYYRKIKNAFPSIATGYGTDGHFADLNRNRPADLHYDFLAFSLHPQAHATDNRTIMENLESQRHVIETLQSFAGGRPIHVSPITLNKRDGNLADERQHTAFAAFWTVMTIQCLTSAGMLTFYELTGSRGILNNELQPSPVWDVLTKIKAFNPKWIVRRFINDQLMMDGLVLEHVSGDRMMIRGQLTVDS
jgi:D-apionolactonase